MKETLVYQRNAEKSTNKIRLPKFFCDKNGYNFIMKIYEKKIEIISIKKDNKNEN